MVVGVVKIELSVDAEVEDSSEAANIMISHGVSVDLKVREVSLSILLIWFNAQVVKLDFVFEISFEELNYIFPIISVHPF